MKQHKILPMILTLLGKVNKVTAYHRHGQEIPKRALDDLANYQIEFETILKSKIDYASKGFII